VEKHGNCKWALDELEWLIYDKYKAFYDDLPEEDKFIIGRYISSLRKLHG
jgi:hypothetical protein